MRLTRFGFNLLAAIYLAPMIVIDIIGNTVNGESAGTEGLSEFYFFKIFWDAALVAYSVIMMFSDKGTVSQQSVSKSSDVADFNKLPAYEYVYCIMLSLYAAANLYFLHAINKQETGIISVGTLVWSIFSFAVCVLSALQFWRIKSGKLIELSHKIVE